MKAQTCDIYTTGIKPGQETLLVGQSADLVFSIMNDAKGIQCAYAANSVSVYLSLPSTGVGFESITSPAEGQGKYFTWTYDASTNTVIGINHTAIGDKEGETDITVKVKATALKTVSSTRTIGVTIVQHPDGVIFPANKEGNDNSIVVLRLRQPEPLEFVSFAASVQECNKIDVVLETASEYGNDFMEVQRSIDGKAFSTLHVIKGTNTNSKAVYTFTDDKDLISGLTYQYRIRQVSRDGKEKYLNSVQVENKCAGEEGNLDIYPNPAFDKVFITIRGISTKENVSLIMTNAVGEQIRIVQSPSVTAPNELKLTGLPAGIYNVMLQGKEEIGSKRFIKIE
jgi:hypothetical protein